MATNYRGRGGRTGEYGQTRTEMWQKTANRTKGTYGTRTVPAQWKTCNTSFGNKINSYKTLYNQTQGTAKYTRPTPGILNTFANWINKGACIQTVSCTQVAKWGRPTKWNFNTRNPNMTTCKSILWNKFGKSTIKAVARTKTGGYMVATTPTYKGKPFNFPH